MPLPAGRKRPLCCLCRARPLTAPPPAAALQRGPCCPCCVRRKRSLWMLRAQCSSLLGICFAQTERAKCHMLPNCAEGALGKPHKAIKWGPLRVPTPHTPCAQSPPGVLLCHGDALYSLRADRNTTPGFRVGCCPSCSLWAPFSRGRLTADPRPREEGARAHPLGPDRSERLWQAAWRPRTWGGSPHRISVLSGTRHIRSKAARVGSGC